MTHLIKPASRVPVGVYVRRLSVVTARYVSDWLVASVQPMPARGPPLALRMIKN